MSLLILFSLFEAIVYALIETHSYICTAIVIEKNISVELTKFDVRVTNLLGQSVIVNMIYKKYTLRIRGFEFSTNLMMLPFDILM